MIKKGLRFRGIFTIVSIVESLCSVQHPRGDRPMEWEIWLHSPDRDQSQSLRHVVFKTSCGGSKPVTQMVMRNKAWSETGMGSIFNDRSSRACCAKQTHTPPPAAPGGCCRRRRQGYWTKVEKLALCFDICCKMFLQSFSKSAQSTLSEKHPLTRTQVTNISHV